MHQVVTVAGLTIDPPLVNGSGVVDVVSPVDDWNVPAETASKLGAFVTKTVTREPRAGNPQPWADVLGDGTLVNAAGLPNPGIVAALEQWRSLPGQLGIPVVMSLGGSASSFPELAELAAAAGWVDALELNLSCPNVDGGLVGADPAATHEVVTRVRARVDLPLFAKLTPACGAPAAVARAAVDAGADALTCGNTMPVRATGPDGVPLLGAGAHGGMSGAGLHPIALRLVAEASAAVEVPVVGLGGVDGEDAARRMREAGASIVGVGTGAVYDAGLITRLAALR